MISFKFYLLTKIYINIQTSSQEFSRRVTATQFKQNLNFNISCFQNPLNMGHDLFIYNAYVSRISICSYIYCVFDKHNCCDKLTVIELTICE